MKPSIPRPKGKAGWLVELVVIVALALGLALAIKAWLVMPARIPTPSMEPTLKVGQRILVNRAIYHFTDPKIGDIVVFRPPRGAHEGKPGSCGVGHNPSFVCTQATPETIDDLLFAKRLVAGPGDWVKIIHGQVIINGEASEAANGPAENRLVYTSCGKPLPPSRWGEVRPDGRCNFPRGVAIPPDRYFMMGDNRGGSNDSRYWGPIPRDWIIGKAFATYWPADRWGLF